MSSKRSQLCWLICRCCYLNAVTLAGACLKGSNSVTFCCFLLDIVYFFAGFNNYYRHRYCVTHLLWLHNDIAPISVLVFFHLTRVMSYCRKSSVTYLIYLQIKLAVILRKWKQLSLIIIINYKLESQTSRF